MGNFPESFEGVAPLVPIVENVTAWPAIKPLVAAIEALPPVKVQTALPEVPAGVCDKQMLFALEFSAGPMVVVIGLIVLPQMKTGTSGPRLLQPRDPIKSYR